MDGLPSGEGRFCTCTPAPGLGRRGLVRTFAGETPCALFGGLDGLLTGFWPAERFLGDPASPRWMVSFVCSIPPVESDHVGAPLASRSTSQGLVCLIMLRLHCLSLCGSGVIGSSVLGSCSEDDPFSDLSIRARLKRRLLDN